MLKPLRLPVAVPTMSPAGVPALTPAARPAVVPALVPSTAPSGVVPFGSPSGLAPAKAPSGRQGGCKWVGTRSFKAGLSRKPKRKPEHAFLGCPKIWTHAQIEVWGPIGWVFLGASNRGAGPFNRRVALEKGTTLKWVRLT